jgi:hypothetical protein
MSTPMARSTASTTSAMMMTLIITAISNIASEPTGMHLVEVG